MPRPRSSQPRIRLNLEVSQSVRERLENLKNETEADSLTEVIRRALAVYELLWDQRKSGGKTIVRHDDVEREIIIVP